MHERWKTIANAITPYRPCLLSSLFGLINTVIAISTHHGEQSILNSSSLAALILSIVSASTYLTLSLITFRKIHRVRERDSMHRHRSDSDSYHLLPEDEMQRQQLLRLLQRENNSKTQKPSSADASQSTFRIALPDSLRRTETRLTAPRSVHENRRTESNYNSRSLNFSPLSPFSSSRRAPSPYEPLREQEQEQESGADSPPQLPQIPPSSPLPQRTFTQSSRATAAAAPPYSPGGRSVEAPIEKRGEIADLTGEVHPLERERLEQEREQEQERERERQRERERARPQYRVVDAPADASRLLSPSPKKNRDRRGGEVRRQRSTSRESRRAEIELERAGGRNGQGRETWRAELEGVKVSPRIMRVETDGWGRR
ncbi:MAG: hypothetical protein Q9184_001176 [Pyrenodesmia sp. 2 TL-2023]